MATASASDRRRAGSPVPFPRLGPTAAREGRHLHELRGAGGDQRVAVFLLHDPERRMEEDVSHVELAGDGMGLVDPPAPRPANIELLQGDDVRAVLDRVPPAAPIGPKTGPAHRQADAVGIVDSKAQAELLFEQPGLDHINFDELDLVLWSMRTGKVLK